jgi:hypothetical protein
MNIKKHPSGNEYIYAGEVWVRNFTKKNIAPLQLDCLFSEDDMSLVLKNEQLNLNYPRVSDENLNFSKICIVSDGYLFEERQKILAKLPKDVCILAVNRALAKWGLYDAKTPLEYRRTINAFVVNNPYKDAITYLPSKNAKYYPTCVASTRTNFDFLKRYAGDVYCYRPAIEERFGINTPESYYIDDYRNPICAAIGFAFQMNVKKLMLFCCDDSFVEPRDNAVRLQNGLYCYKPLLRSHDIIDANLYWLTHIEENEIVVSNYSSGLDYSNAAYIKDEREVISFFTDSSEGTTYEQ